MKILCFSVLVSAIPKVIIFKISEDFFKFRTEIRRFLKIRPYKYFHFFQKIFFLNF